MSNFDESLQELSDTLSGLSLKNEKLAKVTAWINVQDSQAPALSAHNPAGTNTHNLGRNAAHNVVRVAQWATLLARHGLSEQEVFASLLRQRSDELPTFVPVRVPCAYIDLSNSQECFQVGHQVCGGCRLVNYCSKDCQRKHWKLHSSDCKDRIRSHQWQPAWAEEGRPPTFLTGVPRMHPLSRGLPLWGTMPAIDVLKLPPDGAKSRAQIGVAFIASGDLRNMLKTVNGLPEDYAGQVTVLMNDISDYVTLRNILMLRILAKIKNKRRAADIALHLWYTAFIPDMYHTEIQSLATEVIISTSSTRTQLGPQAFLDVSIDQDVRMLCGALLTSYEQYSMADAANELSRVRFDPARIDLRHRQWARCEGSHRLALLEYHRFGLVLPFGGHNAKFNSPNRFLFSPLGEWLQSDGANPLHSWDIEEVVASGKAHGATREDLYGCLYYHVISQLETLAERLTHMRINIKITDKHAVDLATSLRRGDLVSIGLPASTRFDRLDVSNLVDQDYIGITRIFEAWSGFLKLGGGAAIVGHFMNWPEREPTAEPEQKDVEHIVERLLETGKVILPDRTKLRTAKEMEAWEDGLVANANAFAAVHDYSAAFDTYLSKQGLGVALEKAGLRRRLAHEIVPHRLCAPLNGVPSDLPEFKDSESWYLQSNISPSLWTERYIEIVPT
ncbi:zf-MYND and DUF4470 domain-containing protein [Phanerochaete sordida]|uniref:Zf-MYND and DUF4470 domain-containing protein n=1 Tax=Phanerochaete sordida TaxID=48140 RepID=A0A9P3G8R5_9APHY|nr:zf-MYND and DUF4470 domain-containing protein [Phanerochaete sordida]